MNNQDLIEELVSIGHDSSYIESLSEQELINLHDHDFNYDAYMIKKYPWLNAYENAYLYHVGEINEERRKKDWDSYNLLNDMPDGWRIAFGEKMCEEIQQALLEAGWDPKDYKIAQIKEKWGGLCWYDEGHPEKVREIIKKYENLSCETCVTCGKLATYYTTGWICPYCESCIPEQAKKSGRYKPIKKD